MWIVVTLMAATFQISRTSEQHRLRGILDVAEAGYVRFAYGMPIALVGTTLWMLGPGDLPTPGSRFFVAVTSAGVVQILATISLLQAFRIRDFAVGTVYSKTEVVFVGIASALIVGESLGVLGWIGALVCLGGVAWLASAGDLRATIARGFDPAAGFGMLAAAGFALAAVGIRVASTSLEGTAFDRAVTTLTAMLVIQAIVQGAAIAASSTSSVRHVVRAWRSAILVGVLSLGGSLGWALAITLADAVRVRTLGQVEIVMAFAIGVVVHHETHRWPEYVASAVVVAGLVLVVLG